MADELTRRYVEAILDRFEDEAFVELVEACRTFQGAHERSRDAFSTRSEALQRRGALKRELGSVRTQVDSSLRLKYEQELEGVERWLERHPQDAPGFDETKRREALEERIKGFFSDQQIITELSVSRFLELMKKARYERIFRRLAVEAGGWTRLSDLQDGFNNVTVVFEVIQRTEEKRSRNDESKPWHFVKYEVKDPSGYRSLIMWDRSIQRLQPGHAYKLAGVTQKLYENEEQIQRSKYSESGCQDLGPVRE